LRFKALLPEIHIVTMATRSLDEEIALAHANRVSGLFVSHKNLNSEVADRLHEEGLVIFSSYREGMSQETLSHVDAMVIDAPYQMNTSSPINHSPILPMEFLQLNAHRDSNCTCPDIGGQQLSSLSKETQITLSIPGLVNTLTQGRFGCSLHLMYMLGYITRLIATKRQAIFGDLNTIGHSALATWLESNINKPLEQQVLP